MDMHVLDTINKANNNIEELIDEIIELKQSIYKNNCCYGSLDNRIDCTGDCFSCKNKYYEKMRKSMLAEYSINS